MTVNNIEIKKLLSRTIIAATVVGVGLPLFSPPIVDACNKISCRGYETHITTQGKRVNVSVLGTSPLADWEIIPLGYGMTANRRALWEGYRNNWGDRAQAYDISGTVNGTPASGRLFCNTTALIKGDGTSCSGEVNLDP